MNKLREDEDDKRACIMCMDSDRTHVFLPCCHFSVCQNCAQTLKKAAGGTEELGEAGVAAGGRELRCPTCRKTANSIIRLRVP